MKYKVYEIGLQIIRYMDHKISVCCKESIPFLTFFSKKKLKCFEYRSRRGAWGFKISKTRRSSKRKQWEPVSCWQCKQKNSSVQVKIQKNGAKKEKYSSF